MKNFKLRKDLSINFEGKTLYRIEAVNDFNGVKVGDIGGYVEKEENLSDNAWIADNALVSGNALISGNAEVRGNAQVIGTAKVYGNALISGNAWIIGSAAVSGTAKVSGDALISGNAWIAGNVQVSGNAEVRGNAQVIGNASISGNAKVYGNMKLSKIMRANKLNDVIHISGLRFPATITLTGINIGCKHYMDLKDFEKKYKQDGKNNGYTELELDYLYISIKNALKLLKATKAK